MGGRTGSGDRSRISPATGGSTRCAAMVVARCLALEAGREEQGERREGRRRTSYGVDEFPTIGRDNARGAAHFSKGSRRKPYGHGAASTLAKHECPGSAGVGGRSAETSPVSGGAAMKP